MQTWKPTYHQLITNMNKNNILSQNCQLPQQLAAQGACTWQVWAHGSWIKQNRSVSRASKIMEQNYRILRFGRMWSQKANPLQKVFSQDLASLAADREFPFTFLCRYDILKIRTEMVLIQSRSTAVPFLQGWPEVDDWCNKWSTSQYVLLYKSFPASSHLRAGS